MNKRINELRLIDKTTQNDMERWERKRFIIRLALSLAILFSLSISLFFTFYIYKGVRDFPDVTMLSEGRDQTTLIYDINDNLIANMHGDEDRVYVSIDKISKWLQYSVIAIEDIRFYEHNGVDLLGTVRAAISNFTSDDTQGGSTLTQQLVKNSFLKPERSIKRKIIEAILSTKVEHVYNKKQILEMYLNQIYWGNRSYGAQKAAKRYFKKKASELDLAESSFMAGILKAPEGLSPYRNLKGAKKRQYLVLQKMLEHGYINQEQMDKAFKQKLNFIPQQERHSKYAYFIHYVLSELTKKYGDDALRRGGFRIYTTLDPEVQELAENVITNGVKKLSYSGAKQGSLVSIDVKRGYIQALVGGVDFAKSNFNRAFQSKRAAGSSFKPVVYLTGFRLGLITPDSPINDSPISFNTGWNIWSPKNWDGRFMGRMDVRRALTLSRNTPTVRVALKCGIDKIIQTGRMLGLKGKMDRNFSIALGSLGISPLEMATVFSTFARDGVYIEPIAIRKIENCRGQIIEVNNPAPVRAVSPKYVRWLVSILIDVVNKGTGRQAQQPGRQVAGKTGTTDQIRDVWFTGFTPDMVASVWMGNDANKPLHGVFSFNCAMLWGEFAKEYYKMKNIPARKFVLKDVDEFDPDYIKKQIEEEKKQKELEAAAAAARVKQKKTANQGNKQAVPGLMMRTGTGAASPANPSRKYNFNYYTPDNYPRKKPRTYNRNRSSASQHNQNRNYRRSPNRNYRPNNTYNRRQRYNNRAYRR